MISIKDKAAETAKRAGLLTGGLLFCSIGAGFLTFAGWYSLALVLTPIEASLIVGALYIGVGLLMIGLGQKQSRDVPATKPIPKEPQPELPPLMQAFLFGMQAGSEARQPRH